MTRYSEPTQRQIERARAMLFLAETKRALRNEHLSGLTLELEVGTDLDNQRVYRVHASRQGMPITAPEGRDVQPITGTPFTTARFIAIDARKAAKQQQSETAAEDPAANQKLAA
jgi:hypothetical protein